MVFNEDVDIWDDNRVKWAMAYRYMPDRDTLIIPQCNTMSTDPKIEGDASKPFYASRIGLDCTIPLVGNWDPHAFDRSAVPVWDDYPTTVKPMTEAALAQDMEAFIKEAPRSWEEILRKYLGQPYPTIYRAFGTLRHRLGRTNDSPWFRYTLSDRDFAFEPESPSRVSNFDARHRKPE